MYQTAIIGGTGLSEFYDGKIVGQRQTPFGETSADIIEGECGGRKFIFLARHGNPHIIPPHCVNYRANIWALQQEGVNQIIAVNAVGGINPSMPAGSLVFPDQLIDYSHGREHSFSDSSEVALQHIDFSYPFSPSIIKRLQSVASQLGLATHSPAVYGVTQGPRLETAAEINRLERDGCDIVGMTAMPEAGLAAELGMDYASICLVVNPAAGRSDKLITLDDIHAVLNAGIGDVKRLIEKLIPALS